MMSMSDSEGSSTPSFSLATAVPSIEIETTETQNVNLDTTTINNTKKPNEDFQCVIIGDLNTGKTLICEHFFGTQDSEGSLSHTTHYTKKLAHSPLPQINALDTSGDSRLRDMFTSIKGNAFVVVFDVYNHESFVLAEEIIRSVITTIHSRESSESIKVGVKGEVLFILVGNTSHESHEKTEGDKIATEKTEEKSEKKVESNVITTETIVTSDLEEDGTKKEVQREVHFMDAVILANHYGARYIEINAASGNNVATIFWTATRDFLESKEKPKTEKTDDSNYKKPYSRTITMEDLKGPLVSKSASTLSVPVYTALSPILSTVPHSTTSQSENFPLAITLDVSDDLKDQVKESLVYLSPTVDIVTTEEESLRASHRIISSEWDGSIYWDEWLGKHDGPIKEKTQRTNNNNNNNNNSGSPTISFYETVLIGVEEVANIVKSTSTRLSFRLEHGKVLLGGKKTEKTEKSEKSEKIDKGEKSEKSEQQPTPPETQKSEGDEALIDDPDKESDHEDIEIERRPSFYETMASTMDKAVQSLPPLPRPHLKGSNNTPHTTSSPQSQPEGNQKGKNCKIM